ncbi:Nitrogen permease regulator 3 [Arachnomyces sp. PD_36]|nr:Nitrogen permease regulator 3 [Arachnomyces sp. PD_36]
MSSIARPPDPCLVAIILIVQSRAGPRLVYHYPPNPSIPSPTSRRNQTRQQQKTHTNNHDSSSSTDEDGSSSDDAAEGEASGSSAAPGKASRQHTAGGGSGSGGSGRGLMSGDDSASSGSELHPTPVVVKRRGTPTPDRERHSSAGGDGGGGDAGEGYKPPWETLLGLHIDVWEKLLSPSRTWHKRRFEVGINDLAFVGWPVFVREDGLWRKKKKRKEKRAERTSWAGGELGDNTDGDGGAREDGDEDVPRVNEPEGMISGERKAARAREGEGKHAKTQDPLNGAHDAMSMFNVVFVLNPPVLEYSIRIKEKYESVIKKFGKALKWEQARGDYVWSEAQTILHLKERARENHSSPSSLYAELVAKSSLAKAISTIYTSISTSRIASVTLTPRVSISLQIPPLTSTSYLPTGTEPSYPGLWLTTADSVSPADDDTVTEASTPNQVLAKHFSLLLLDNEANILRDIEASAGSLGRPLAHYIRSSKPTKTFAQVSALSGIPLRDIQILASHLVYWRRARAVPPLNQRDTYIVSPNADMSKLSIATTAYAAAFPTMPSLPKMLSALSGPPRPYASLIPSRDHKETYFQILAWLLRGGWVTQLRTFAWVKVTPAVKTTVQEAIRKEELEKKRFMNGNGNGNHNKNNNTKSPPPPQPTTSPPRPLSSHSRRSPSSSSSSSSLLDSGDETPVPNKHTRIRPSFSLLRQHSHQSAIHHPQPPPAPQQAPPHQAPENRPLSSLILHPHRASPLETRWLEQIITNLTTSPSHHQPTTSSSPPSPSTPSPNATSSGNDIDLRTHWTSFSKYFNGKDAMEKIVVLEGLKRKVVWRVLGRMGLSVSGQQQPTIGYTGTGGEDEDEGDGGVDGGEERALVAVRHW